MIERVILLIIVILIVFIEFVRQLFKVGDLGREEEFVTEYHNKLVDYVKSGNDEVFVWLTQNAVKMQNNMGGYAEVSYRPPFANYIINNYLLIVNGIDEIKKEMSIGYGENQHFELIRSAILKYSGSIINNRENKIKTMKNPVKLLVNSVRNIVLLPIVLLHELGILGSEFFVWMKQSYIISFVSGTLATLDYEEHVMRAIELIYKQAIETYSIIKCLDKEKAFYIIRIGRQSTENEVTYQIIYNLNETAKEYLSKAQSKAKIRIERFQMTLTKQYR